MKVSKELAKILKQVQKEVNKWPKWQRSLDPQGEANEQTKMASDGDIGI